MFYSTELSRNGKTPLARMWQACHGIKMHKKVVEDFNIETGIQAIEAPQEGKHALRLTANLLLGVSKIHSIQVNNFANTIKTVQERITLSFTSTTTTNVDLKPSRKTDSVIGNITLNITDMLDDTLTLDIPDELPAHLAGGEEAHLTQLSQGAEFSMGPVRSHRGKNAAINLPSQSLASTADSISDAMEDMSDLLHPGFEDSAGGENPLDIPFDDFEGDGSIASKEAAAKTKASSKHASSAVPSRSINGGDSSSGNGAGFSELDSPVKQAEGESSQFDMEHFEHENDVGYGRVDSKEENAQQVEKGLLTITKSRKRKNKHARLDDKTQISEEYKRWIHDPEFTQTHLCRGPRPLPTRKVPTIERAISLPLVRHLGKALTNHFENLGYQENKPVKESRRKIKQDQEKDEPTSPSKYGQNVDMAEQDNDYEQRNYAPGILDEIDFEPLGSLSISNDQPEKLRDGNSIDGSIKAPGSKRSSRMSSDSFAIPDAFNFDAEESSQRSSLAASSRRSKLSIVGDDPFGMDDESHNTFFQDASLREEPESHPSLLKNQSQQPLSQRIPPHAMAIAHKVAQNLPNQDSELSFFEIVNPNNKTKLVGARVFYSMLILHHEGVVKMVQPEPYGDITIGPTAQTQNYNY